MQLNWFTFFLQLINFAVLAWVLSRILYKPVRATLQKRQAEVTAILTQAQQTRDEAAALDARYRAELDEWSRAADARRAALDRELADERARRLQRVDEQLRAEREAEAHARAEQRVEERARIEAEAIHLATSFASRLLADLAGPELHHRILERFVDEVPHLPVDLFEHARGERSVDVRSAYPLDAAEKDRLARAFSEVLKATVRLEVREAPELIAGVEVHVGAAALEANVAREMSYFADTADTGHAG